MTKQQDAPQPDGKTRDPKASTTTGKSEPLEAIEALIDKAEDQGYLTVEDVLELFPGADKNLPRLAELMMFLYDAGIEIITPGDDAEKTEAASAGSDDESDEDEELVDEDDESDEDDADETLLDDTLDGED